MIHARGVVVREPGGPLTVEDLELEGPGPGEVLVRLLASGVCHSDLHVALGRSGRDFPYLLGHEGFGVIEAVGPGVDPDRTGERVILCWRAPCGRCRFCLRGDPVHCADVQTPASRIRSAADGAVLTPMLRLGTFTTHTVVTAGEAVAVDADLPPEVGCLIGCGVTTGVGSAMRTAGVESGSSVAVFGCGGVGTSVIQGARLANAARIIAVDLSPAKLELAMRFGATDVVDASAGDPVERVRSLTGGSGVDYAFDVVGVPETFRQALGACDQSGTCVLVGVPPQGAEVTLPMSALFGYRRRVLVSWYGDCLGTRDFPQLARWYRDGRLLLDELVSERIGLGDVSRAFDAMHDATRLRSVIVFD
ncbi:MAG TPA: Zn-dependent alcohol dehydrogenase [Candidatus Dormibacteraeota bacterium]|jgi:S-(hydroxymethyl)mycothiol dehydrogenase